MYLSHLCPDGRNRNEKLKLQHFVRCHIESWKQLSGLRHKCEQFNTVACQCFKIMRILTWIFLYLQLLTCWVSITKILLFLRLSFIEKQFNYMGIFSNKKKVVRNMLAQYIVIYRTSVYIDGYRNKFQINPNRHVFTTLIYNSVIFIQLTCGFMW